MTPNEARLICYETYVLTRALAEGAAIPTKESIILVHNAS